MADVKLPRNVKLLGVTSFFTDVGSEMILPVLPLFLKGPLGAPMWAIGVIEGGAEAVANGMKLASGFLSDRAGKSKPFVYLGYGLSTAVKPLLALAGSWPVVLALRGLDKIGKGFRTSPRDAIVAASTPKEIFGRAYGFHRAMDTGGALVGSAIAAAVVWKLGDVSGVAIRWMFAASLLPCALAIVFIGPVQEPEVPRSNGKPGRALDAFRLSGTAWLLLAGVALWELANVSYAFVLLRLQEVGVPSKFVPAVYLAFNLVYLAVAVPWGMLTDRIGVTRALFISPLAGAAAFLVLGVPNARIAVVGGMILYAVHSAAINTVPRAAVAHFAGKGSRATMFGLVGACALLGNVLAGSVWDWLGSARAMQAAGLLSLLALVPFSLLRAAR